MSFYNTTNEAGRTLEEFESIAGKQEREILSFFKLHWHREMSPSYVWQTLYGPAGAPLTSVRRAISNLTTKGHLEQTNNRQLGIFGRPEKLWKYKTDEVVQMRLEL
jgi:hypothetical protein